MQGTDRRTLFLFGCVVAPSLCPPPAALQANSLPLPPLEVTKRPLSITLCPAFSSSCLVERRRCVHVHCSSALLEPVPIGLSPPMCFLCLAHGPPPPPPSPALPISPRPRLALGPRSRKRVRTFITFPPASLLTHLETTTPPKRYSAPACPKPPFLPTHPPTLT